VAPTPAPTLVGAGRGKDTLTRGFLLTQSPDAGRGRAAKVGKGVGELDLGFWMFNFFPQLRDALSRGLGFEDS